jgi:hypothetical protein
MSRTVRLLPTLLLALAACGDSTAPSKVGADLTTDVAVASTDAAKNEIALLALDEDAAQAAASGCTYDAATVRWSCASATETGAAQSSYSPTETGSINFVTTAAGSRSGQGSLATVARHRTVTVSGLAGTETERVWNGSGVDTLDVEVQGTQTTRRYTMRSAVTMSDVVFNVPRSAQPYPQSGQLRYDIIVTQTADGAQSVTRVTTRRVTITFNGTAAVPMQVGTLGCTLYLDTRGVACGAPPA